MLMLRHHLILTGLFALASAAAFADEKKSGDPEFITKAIEELKTEMETALKDPVGSSLRDKSDYFAKGSETLDEAELLKVLGRRLDRNAVVDAYVKWQLLSLQQGAFSDENAKVAFRLYRSAIAAPARPGTGSEGEMQAMLRQVNKDNYTQANAAWESRVAAHNKIATPIWSYREELYARLPKSFDVLRAAFDDAEARMQRGYDARKFVDRISADLRGLAAASKPVEINRMVQLARFYSTREGSQTFDSLQEDKGNIKWKTGKPRFDKKKMDQLAKDLEETAKLGF